MTSKLLLSCSISSISPLRDKGYIDLSKRRVSKEDIERCTEKYLSPLSLDTNLQHLPTLRYSKAKAVNSIVRHVAEILGIKTNEELEDLYRLVKSVLLAFFHALFL